MENDSLTVRRYSVEVSKDRKDRMAIFRLYEEKSKKKKGRTSNWSIVITIIECDMVNVIRIHTVVVAVRLILVLFCFLDATTVHLR